MIRAHRRPGSDALTLIVRRTESATADGITRAISSLIGEGALPANTLLPTVRDVAQALQMSNTTVHKAWQKLQVSGLLRTEGRRGTFVQPAPRERSTARWRQHPIPEFAAYDLSTGAPNAQLLPSLHLGMLDADAFRQSSYHGAMVVPALETAIREEWGQHYTPASLTVVNGSLDALDRLIRLYVRRGNRVVIEDPTFPPMIRLLELAGAVIIPVALDEDGPIPAHLAAALARNPALVIFQPRAQNPTGAALTLDRADELARVLRGSGSLIVEHDSAGSISAEPLITLADHLPDRVLRIHGFSKSHGPDLRLAAIGGPTTVIDELTARRMLDSAWSSRILQLTLVGLLSDETARLAVDDARYFYRQRRTAIQQALAERGIETMGRDGYNVWVPVSGPAAEPVALAMHGFLVANGSAFQLADGAPHCRVTVSALPIDLIPHVAGLLAGHTPTDSPRAVVGN